MLRAAVCAARRLRGRGAWAVVAGMAVIGQLGFMSAPVAAQAPAFNWANKSGGTIDVYARPIAVDLSGNVYVTGRFDGMATFGATTLTSAGGEDVFIAKLDTSGAWQWAKRAGGTFVDAGVGVAVDISGNVYITGSFAATADFGSTTLMTINADVFVAKLDTDGAWLWAKQAGGPSLGETGVVITVSGSGAVYVAGQFSGTSTFGSTILVSDSNGNDVFVAKLSMNGAWLWAKQGGDGGPLGELPYGIAVDGSGNVYISGTFQNTATFGSTTTLTSPSANCDLFVAKLNPDGDEWLWARQAFGTSHERSFGIGLDASGNAYIAGWFRSGTAIFGSTTLNPSDLPNGSDVFVAKLNSNGAWLWARQSVGDSRDEGYSIAVDNAGNSYVAGRFAFTTAFGSTIFNNPNNFDAFVAKLDTNGAWLWAKEAGGSGEDTGRGIAVDVAGNVYSAGMFEGTAAFGSTNLASTGPDDVFITKIGSAPLPDRNDVYVDFSEVTNGIGMESSPFNNLADAQAVANSSATIHMNPGISGEIFSGGDSIDKQLLFININAAGGPVVIGRDPPIDASPAGFITRSKSK